MGSIRQRGRVWWVRYYSQGRRIEESTHTTDRAQALNLLEHKLRSRQKSLPCDTCGGFPTDGPKSFTVAWLTRVERRYGGRLPSVATLEAISEKEIWARLMSRKRTA